MASIGRKYCSAKCSAAGYAGFRHSDKAIESMRAAWTEARREAARSPRITKTCAGCQREFSVTNSVKGRRRVYCSAACQRAGLITRNPVHRPSVRAKLLRAVRNRSSETLRRISAGVSKAWADGKFDGVATGKCDWFSYKRRDRSVCKVQGTWELALAEFLDRTGVSFVAHRGRFRYVLNGRTKNWYPDFYVPSWGEWLDVKAPYFYSAEKFEAIRRCNPGVKVRVMFLKDLTSLGVEIYAPGNSLVPRLAALVRRCRIQPRVRK